VKHFFSSGIFCSFYKLILCRRPLRDGC
jgi:hypothetical protein